MSVGSFVPSDLRSRRAAHPSPWPGTLMAPEVLAVGALTILAAGLRFWGIGHQGFWYDEADTAQLVGMSAGKMLGLLPHTESTPPLYYCIAWVWVRIFGDHEAGLRSLSAVAGVLVVPVAYVAAAKLMSRRAGLITAALTACNPLLIWYSQEARSYSLLVLLTAVSLAAFAYARAEPTGRALTVWVIACVLSEVTHYYAVVIIVPEAVWLLVEHRRRRAVWTAVGVLAVCGLALLPLLIYQNGTRRDAWIASSPFAVRLRQIIPQFLIGTNAPHRTVVKYVTMGLAVLALALLAARATAAERRPALVAGSMALGGFILSLLFVAVGFDDLITRNIIALWLPAAILIAGGLAAGQAGRLGLLVTVAVCASGVFATVGIAANRSMQRPDWRYVARALGTRRPAAPGRAILVQHYQYLLPLSLYLPGLKVFHAPELVDQIEVISVVSPSQPLCWWGAACNLIPSQMQRRYAIPGFHIVARRHVLQWTILTMDAGHPVRLTRHDVSRALHTTTLHRDELIYQRG